MIEYEAEGMCSILGGQVLGTFGRFGNGNKMITISGGGVFQGAPEVSYEF